MSSITINSATISNWNATTGNPKLRLYVDRGFITSDGRPVLPGSPQGGQTYLEAVCTLAGTTLTIPQIVLDSTTDGQDITNARYTAIFFSASNAQLFPYAGFESFRLNSVGTTQTWAQVRAFNFTLVTTPDNSAYTKAQSDARYITTAANPTASVGLAAVNGVATTAMRSDAAPPLSQAIAPTWTGVHAFSPTARTSGSAAYLTINIPADTTLTASTEAVGFNTITAVRQWAAGAFATQREFLFNAPTYAFAGASTLTNAATVAISGAPIAGANATITNPYSFWVQGGTTNLADRTKIGLGSTVNEPGQFNLGATATSLQIADSTNPTPLVSANPNVVIQTTRGAGNSFINLAVASYKTAVSMAEDMYGIHAISRFTANLTSLNATNFNVQGGRANMIVGPSNVGTNAVHGYGWQASCQADITGVRLVGLQADVTNNTSTDMAGDLSVINSSAAIVVSYGGSAKNSVGILGEGPGSVAAFARGYLFNKEHCYLYGIDMYTNSFTLTGTWTSNGTTTLTGTSSKANSELVIGDRIVFNTVTYTVSSIGSDTSVTTVETVPTASGLTVVKKVKHIRLGTGGFIVARNAANTADFNMIGSDSTDRMLIRNSNAIIFQNDTGATEYARLNSTGLGIGAAPAELLTLSGTGLVYGRVVSTTTGSANEGSLKLQRGDSANGYAQASYYTSTTSNWALGLRAGDSNLHFFDSVAAADRLVISTLGLFNAVQGGAVASAATITPTGNSFHVTGAVNITAISGTNIQTGTIITIIFDSNPLLTNGANLQLAGTVNLTPTAGSVMQFYYDGASVWREVSRAIR